MGCEILARIDGSDHTLLIDPTTIRSCGPIGILRRLTIRVSALRQTRWADRSATAFLTPPPLVQLANSTTRRCRRELMTSVVGYGRRRRTAREFAVWAKVAGRRLP